MIIKTKQMGKVVYNSGDFAQIVAFNDDGINRGFVSDFIQISADEAKCETEEFQHEFRAGAVMEITETLEINPTLKTYEAADIDGVVDEIRSGVCESEIPPGFEWKSRWRR